MNNKLASDFASKLLQPDTLPLLRKYILWRKGIIRLEDVINCSPISINLDPTTACNFNCSHCVDKKIIKTGKTLSLGEIGTYIQSLKVSGLKSVILIGGGEPLLHKDIKEIITLIKSYDIQLSIVTNGVYIDKIYSILPLLKKPDYIRLSVDAGSNEYFQSIHQTKESLEKVLSKASKIKEINSDISLGYSYIVDCQNEQSINDITKATELAEKYKFDYISFKPCMTKVEDYETLLKLDSKPKQTIQEKIELASRYNIKVLTSENFRALFNNEDNVYRNQPTTCHIQFFRSVVSPLGLFNCPAYRGSEFAEFNSMYKDRLKLIDKFNAQTQCKDVACFYNNVNWWIEDLIKNQDLIELNEQPITNSFL